MTTAPEYFYRDSLAAAWMVKHHGVNLNWGGDSGTLHYPEPSWGAILYTLMDYDTICGISNVDKFYLDSASLHLLEPQIGDLYFSTEDQIAFRLTDDLCKKWSVRPAGEIVQRAGIAFHWPEQEAA
jgi:hypothetical protein